MAILQTKYVDVGVYTIYSTTITGFISTGTISNTQNGSSDVNLDSVFSGADITSFYHSSTSGQGLSLSLSGNRANGTFDTLKIGGVSFARSAATHSYNSSNNRTTWTWSYVSSSPFGTTVGADKQVTWETASTVTAPVLSGVSNNNAAAPTVTATISLSSSGSGGTLQYAQTTSNSAPSSGWSAAPTFSHPRGATRYYWARRDTNTVTSSVSHSVGYLTGDIGFSKTSPTITSGASSATTTIQYATAGETLAIRVDGQSTNLVTAVVASSTQPQNISFSSSLPSAGSSSTYRFFVRRPTSTGGDGSTFVDTTLTFTVTRASAAPAAPTNLTFSTATTASSSTNVTVTASGGGTGTLKVSADGTNWYANGTSFGSRARGTAHTWYARVESTLNSSNYTEAHTPPYLSPATGTAANDIILSGASSHTGSISGGAAGTVYEFRSGGYTGTILATVNGNGTAACSGGAGTYYVTRYKTTGTGGSGTSGRANLTTYTVSAVSKRTFTIQINFVAGNNQDPATLLGPTVTVDTGSITGSVTSSTNPLEVSVGDDVIWKRSHGLNTVTVSGINAFTDNSNIAVTQAGVTRTLANGANGDDQMLVLALAGGGNDSDYYYIERVGGIDPPSGLSAGLGGNESQTETVTLSQSTAGSGGTLEYLQRSVTSMASSGWQTSNQFSQTRNTTRYYWVSRNRNTDSYEGPLTVTVNYLGAVTTGYSFDTASGNIGYGDGAPAISFTAAQANHTVAIFEGTTIRSAAQTGGTDYNNIATNQIPPAGGSNTYNLRTYRNSAAGGNPSPTYVATNASTITIKRYPQTPSGLTTFTDGGTEAASGTFTIAVGSLGGASSTTITLSSNYTTNAVANGSAIASVVRAGDIVYARNTGANGLTASAAIATPATYLGPKPFSYSTPATISYAATSHVLTITGADPDHTYGWGIGVVGKGTRTYTDSSTITISSNSALPQPGEQNNYVVSVRRGTASGGQNNLVSQTTPVNVKRYPQQPSGITTFTDGGTEAASGTFTIAVGNLDGATATAPTLSTSITLSPNYTTNAVANGSAIASVVRAGDIVYARNTGANGLTAQAPISTAATYLLPNTPSLPNISNAYNTATHSVDITSMPTTVYYEVRTESYTGTQRGAVTNGGGGSTKNITVTQINTGPDTVTYYVRGYRLATAGGDGAWDNLGTYTVTEGEEAIIPPTGLTMANNNASADEVQVTCSLSVNGSGGTLEYARNNSPGSAPAAALWQTSNLFQQERGTTKYYWASRNRGQTGSSAGNNNTNKPHVVGYISPDLEVSAVGDAITSTATSASVTVNDVTSGETYAVRVNNGSTNLATATASSTSVTIGPFTGSLPTTGNSTTYEIFSFRPDTLGGSATYVATDDTFTITRQATGGSTGGGSTGTSSYGVEIYNASAQPTWGTGFRSTNIVARGTVTLAGATTTTVTNIEDITPTNTDKIALIVSGPGTQWVTITRGTGGFSVYNPSTLSRDVGYTVVRYG
jgi:hypothetical protein